VGDQPEIVPIEQYNCLPTNLNPTGRWDLVYDGGKSMMLSVQQPLQRIFLRLTWHPFLGRQDIEHGIILMQ
jgi:hypothetical protein